MICRKCGNEIEEGEKYCGKCGNKIEQDTNKEFNNIQNINIRETIKAKNRKKIIMLIVIIVAIIVILLLKNRTPLISGLIPNVGINEDKIVKMLKKDEYGMYLQEDTTKIGDIEDIVYENYDKLISYSCDYRGQVLLNAGGLLLYNSSTEDYKVLYLNSDFMSIVYYLITNNMSTEVKEVTKIFVKYISEKGESIVNFEESYEDCYEVGTEIGKAIGVNLCRNLGKETIHSLNSLSSDTYLLYKENEISARYYGMISTEKDYVWDIKLGINEQAMQILYAHNRSSYNNMVIMYGEPYQIVTKFCVYDVSKGKMIGKYSDIEEAKKKLNVEE